MTDLLADAPPHVLLITCHDLGRYLGCYGNQTIHTPHLDTLAVEGIRCARAFATAPSCSPSRAGVTTGRYPHSNGVMGLTHPPFGWDLAADERPTAALLGAAGYETHLFGFQHVTTQPERLGFQYLHGFDRLLGCHEKAWGRRVSREVADFLRSPLTGRPLYLEINLEEPHRPYDQDGAQPDASRGVTIPAYLPNDASAYEEMAAFQGAVRCADEAVGDMLAALDEAGLRESTLVIFLADHGIAMPRAKCTLYDPGIEVALLIRWPAGGFAAGAVIPEMISTIDVLPTVLAAASLPVPERVQGRSLLPLLGGEEYVPRTAIYAEKTYHTYYDPMRAVRTERFKYIRSFETTPAVEIPLDIEQGAIFRAQARRWHAGERHPVELYDLQADPLEQSNLAGNAAFAEVEGWLESRLWSWMAETADPLLAGPIPSPTYLRSLTTRTESADRTVPTVSHEDEDSDGT